MRAPVAPLPAPFGRSDDAGSIPHTSILRIPVSRTNMQHALSVVGRWIAAGRSNFICVRDVHGVMRAADDPSLLDLHWSAGMVVPDGMPLVWLSKLKGGHEVDRVCGPDLVDALCAATASLGVRHYFYGGKAGVAETLAQRLTARHPGLTVVGVRSPPFGVATHQEDTEETAHITATRPQIVWVGLSTPKQEMWMQSHVGRIPGATLIGVGAAFDMHAGIIKRAPKWMQRTGLEWLHRLLSEPKRLWRRYLLLAPRFVVMAAWELLTPSPKPSSSPRVKRSNPG